MLAKTFGASPFGFDGTLVQIEGALQRGLPQMHVTGLPNDVIREGRERIRACLCEFGFETPSSRVVIHLSPATTKKQGSQLDLAIAMAVLRTEGILRRDISRTAFLGELGLDGGLRSVTGAISLVEILEKCRDIDTILVPTSNAREVALLSPKKVRLASNISEVIDFIGSGQPLPVPLKGEYRTVRVAQAPTFDHVNGQELAKRALQIALTGRHHLCFIGPPGVGKSLIAGCAPNLLPHLTERELVEVVRIYSFAAVGRDIEVSRPFRAPHHSVSAAGLLGGGSGTILPGEVTLAHNGVLFLDEFPEYRRDAVEGLREPLQNGQIQLQRIGHSLALPARFTLVAAMNPCPCGNYRSSKRSCRCSLDRIARYQRRVSGAIFDRMDLCVVMNPVPTHTSGGKTHAKYRDEISQGYQLQLDRYRGREAVLQNGDLTTALLEPCMQLESKEQDWFDSLTQSGDLSYRSLFKILKVARTIADLDSSPEIRLSHLFEAKALRCPDSYMA